MYRTTSQSKDPATTEEGKKIVDELARLKYEVQHDRQLVPIRDDGFPDVDVYNKELEQLGNPSWLSVSWLYSECYLFRRMSTSFALSEHWKTYDVFARQKIKTFRSSRPAVLELASRYKALLKQIEESHGKPADEEAEKILFMEMCEICLWGNATDLSLLTNLTYEDIQKLQGSEARKNAEKNILVNDLPAVYDLLKKAKAEGKKERRVDIVLDNAGFELFVDLILAGYLLSSGLATHVVLHPKDIPWFVSDVLPSDFAELLNALASPKKFYETPSEDEELQNKTPAPLADKEAEDLSFLFQNWSQLYAEGQVILRPNRFWTHPGSFWRLPGVAKELHEDLKTSEVVLFKGDLNYRKLTGDVSLPCCHEILIHHPPGSLTPSAGEMGCFDALHRGDWSVGAGLWGQCAGPADLQGGCRCGPTPRERRGAACDGRRRRRLWGAEVGMERQVGRGLVLIREVRLCIDTRVFSFRDRNRGVEPVPSREITNRHKLLIAFVFYDQRKPGQEPHEINTTVNHSQWGKYKQHDQCLGCRRINCTLTQYMQWCLSDVAWPGQWECKRQ